ncbi:hypothetical protein NBRC111894_4359 [Sporolactobacillus inulinus]|uniref:Uncharacterized protein n=1 Tax=Sporolactobacillus inulinus TaxID=2078 RepID=A0A4Y1ZI44_9BACL|nr:hypothetical protein NBRC111894_4359 [Sporolactobacillus inulinus]
MDEHQKQRNPEVKAKSRKVKSKNPKLKRNGEDWGAVASEQL